MPERFKPESLPTPEQEEQKFWDEEIRAMLEQKENRKTLEKLSREELIGQVMNNFHGWLPATGEHSFVGTHRSPEYLEDTQPDKRAETERLITDIDAYLKQNNLLATVHALEEQQATIREHNMAYIRAGKYVPEFPAGQKVLSEGEIRELMADLYYAMRKKGYSRELLAT